MVDGSSQVLPPAGTTPVPAASPAITIGGTPYTADSSGNFVINGQTLNPSNPITVSGTPISILPGNTAVAVGSSIEAIVTPPPNANNENSPAEGSPPLTIDGSTYYPTGPSSAYVLPGGQTLTPGVQVTVGGTPVSLASDGSMAVVGGSSENLAPTITPPPGKPVLTFDGTTYSPTGASSAYVIGGQTLIPGAGPITVSGTPISLAANGANAVVGSSTENLQPAITAQPGLTFDGTTYQPTSVPGASSAYIIDGQTITPRSGPSHHFWHAHFRGSEWRCRCCRWHHGGFESICNLRARNHFRRLYISSYHGGAFGLRRRQSDSYSRRCHHGLWHANLTGNKRCFSHHRFLNSEFTDDETSLDLRWFNVLPYWAFIGLYHRWTDNHSWCFGHNPWNAYLASI